tara:strand:- start:72 stop:380 length:309 start_codon:yes stop_codon:yes gene_type:complete
MTIAFIGLLFSACSTGSSNGDSSSGGLAQTAKEETTNIRIWLKETVEKKTSGHTKGYCGEEEECGRIAYGGGSINGIDLDSDCWSEAEIGADLPDSCLIFKK